MKISVVIPAYNAAATLAAALDSVLAQTVPPQEILVFDDGSTDQTPAVLEAYQPRVRVFRQANQGVAHARNFLCEQAEGEIIAFLDADDVWHPAYLETQCRVMGKYPEAVAFFTEHENFVGSGDCQWKSDLAGLSARSELINPLEFIPRYDQTPLSFQMSCCCVPQKVLKKMGKTPFPVGISGADDTYLHNLLPLLGPVVHTPAPLAGYRITDSSISANRIKMSLLVIGAFEMLEARYRTANHPALHHAFKLVFASRHRNCGKFLMGAGRTTEARAQFLSAVGRSRQAMSVAKSLGLYCLTLLPGLLQPRWPAGRRMLNGRVVEAAAA